MMLPDWLPARIRARITVADMGYFKGPCWLVSGWNDGKGHAKVRWGGRCTYVHRVTLGLFSGVDPKELDTVDHLCRQEPCCNPDHLEDVTSKINTDRGLGVANQFRRSTEYALP